LNAFSHGLTVLGPRLEPRDHWGICLIHVRPLGCEMEPMYVVLLHLFAPSSSIGGVLVSSSIASKWSLWQIVEAHHLIRS
jgi:hypothetical protein